MGTGKGSPLGVTSSDAYQSNGDGITAEMQLHSSPMGMDNHNNSYIIATVNNLAGIPSEHKNINYVSIPAVNVNVNACQHEDLKPHTRS
ncbi:hypothetical protein AALO_G00150780 [Alosa alosa]|uniref:Uncharacterized protein n=1 Tax=Alosa alosa TaxID=278164 RepID=A0AAV6GKT6_9TELE|nr:hypothetical protein AALO_G00150780 [Alosa alosa]